jgi:hypothetical protein
MYNNVTYAAVECLKPKSMKLDMTCAYLCSKEKDLFVEDVSCASNTRETDKRWHRLRAKVIIAPVLCSTGSNLQPQNPTATLQDFFS